MKQEIGDEIWESQQEKNILTNIEFGRFSFLVWKIWIGINLFYKHDDGGWAIFLGFFQLSYFKDN